MTAWMTLLVPWIDALGWSLLHFIWQGALIGILYASLRPVYAGVQSRYRLGMVALLAMCACPVVTLLWLRPGVTESMSIGSTTSIVSGAIVASASQLASTWHWQQVLPCFVGAWLLGVGVIATRSFLHWRRLSRIVRDSVALPREWQLILIQLRMRFGILRPVRLLSSMHIATPTLIGWLKPAILLPASLLSGFTPAQVELIIAHELSHVRRFDYIANLAQVAIETLLFYHPAVHWISRDVRQARESCCDDLVLTLGGGNAMAYARTLADLEELHHQGYGAAMPALGAAGGVLFARIRRIVDPTKSIAVDPLPRSNGLTLPVLCVIAGLALVMLRLHPLPSDVAAALRSSPVSRAAVFGNSAWMVPRVFAPIASEPPVLAAPAAESRTASPQPAAAALVQPHVDSPARPRVSVAMSATEKARVENLTARIDGPAALVLTSMSDDASPMIAAPSSAMPKNAPVVGPVPAQMVQPRYPLEALQNGITGKVDLDFRIAADGSVKDVRILHAQPSGVFEQSALVALKQWRFASNAGVEGTRYARSFAFTRADSAVENCREVTGSHICRRADGENVDN